ncbi:STAS/SEC14 domain-containing protein [Prosthecomicrobium sp. N25]|uniref:STAS/SEC14 domain-containing protein n=1 Tax=Prosthecomicrobium sp. N25 TaxID=3129254 RepID=UPI003076A001
MDRLAPDGSVAEAHSPRADLLVFEIRARITKPDMEWMARLVEEAFDRHEAVDMLVVMRNYQGADWGAVLDAEFAKAQARATNHVRRYAVVGAPAWARAMIEVADVFSPVDAKTFALEEEAEAWAWVNGAA